MGMLSKLKTYRLDSTNEAVMEGGRVTMWWRIRSWFWWKILPYRKPGLVFRLNPVHTKEEEDATSTD